MPTTTTLSDCLLILGISVAVAAGHFLTGLSGMLRPMEVQRFAMALSRGKPPRSIDPGVASHAVRSFYRSPTAFFVCWLPWLGLVGGNVVISLLRDSGIKIVPWPILINSCLLVVLFFIAARIKFLRLTRIVSAA